MSAASALRHGLSRRAVAALVLGSAGLLVLAGCAPESPQGPGPDPTSSQPAPTEDPGTDPGTEEPGGEKLAISCEEILSPDDVYAYNPNVGTAPDYSPTAAAVRAAVELGGVACGWSNQTSGVVMEIAVARPDEAATLERTDEALARLNPVPTYGTPPEAEGFFGVSSGVGEAQLFADGYWITLSAADFFEPGDVQGLVETVRGNLDGR